MSSLVALCFVFFFESSADAADAPSKPPDTPAQLLKLGYVMLGVPCSDHGGYRNGFRQGTLATR
jgi:hypothetical protein